MQNERVRLEGLMRRFGEVCGQLKALQAEQAQVQEQVSLAKGRLTLEGTIREVLEQLQNRANKRAVGDFEELLTAIINDVLPQAGRVRFDLGMERGAPALDIAMEREGQLEDILEGRGGSLNNIIAIGLRFSALSRTANRPFMLLDEPDGGVSQARIARLIQVIVQVAEQSSTQTVLVTHNGCTHFPDGTHIVRFYDADGKTVVEPTMVPEWAPDMKGIRAIRLINVGRHEDTYLPLAPTLTAFIGDNEVGKSTVGWGLRAMTTGSSSDRLIRHGADHAKVIIYLEDGLRLEWKRQREGSPKTYYELYKEGTDTPIRDSRGQRGTVPGWVKEILGIHEVDGLNIQLGHQLKSIFLLEDSPSTRASLLSVGRESGYISAMIEEYSRWLSKDKETAQRGEARLSDLVPRVAALQLAVDQGVGPAKTAPLLASDIENRRALLKKLKNWRADHTSTASVFAYNSRVCAAFEANVPQVPQLSKVAQARDLLARMTKAARVASAPIPPRQPEAPQLRDTRRLRALAEQIRRLSRGADAARWLQGAPSPAAPELKAAARSRLLLQCRAADQELKSAEASLSEADKSLVQAKRLLEEVIEKLGGKCPTCGEVMRIGHELAHSV